MPIAPSNAPVPVDGGFYEKEYGHWFDFRVINPDEWGAKFGATHAIFVGMIGGNDQGYRFAKVKKTVAYVAIDEDGNGNPVWEKWHIKGLRFYSNDG